MRRLIRNMVVGTLIGWATKYLADLRRRWATRPAAEIRQRIDSILPGSISPVMRDKLTDRVVDAVKGPSVGGTPPDQTVANPPPPDTPIQLHPQD